MGNYMQFPTEGIQFGPLSKSVLFFSLSVTGRLISAYNFL